MAKNESSCQSRLNRVGGQAVLEGVMMKAGTRTVTTCRKEDGSLVVFDDNFVSVRKKYKILDIPIIRGVVNFIEMMKLSMKTLNSSAEALGIEEEEEGKVEKWMKKHLGIGITEIITGIASVIGVVLALFLFMFLPTAAASGIDMLYSYLTSTDGLHPTVIAVIEGVMKVAIFVTYIALVGLIPDIKRTFMYHGAEHKSIACFEAGDELTPENAAKHKRFHPRCGTSFMFLMILLGIFVGMFIRNMFPGLPDWGITLVKIGILPLLMGVGYEILMIAGKHDNVVTRIISAPGIWMQNLTTKEPTEDMLEVAITSIKCALRDDFPEFAEFYEQRGWEKKPECDETTSESSCEGGACVCDGDTCTCDGETCTCDGDTCTCEGETCTCEGDTCTCDGETCTCDGEACICDGETCTCGGAEEDKSNTEADK
jgi:uncharacterized protein YqhQ